MEEINAGFGLRIPALNSTPNSCRFTHSSAIFPFFSSEITMAAHATDLPCSRSAKDP